MCIDDLQMAKSVSEYAFFIEEEVYSLGDKQKTSSAIIVRNSTFEKNSPLKKKKIFVKKKKIVDPGKKGSATDNPCLSSSHPHPPNKDIKDKRSYGFFAIGALAAFMLVLIIAL